MSAPQALVATGSTYEAQFVDVSNAMLSGYRLVGQPLQGPIFERSCESVMALSAGSVLFGTSLAGS
jgi:hypothetical protein